MRGHDYIVNFRQRGYRPASVFVFDWPAQVSEPTWLEDFQRMEVCTHGDSVGSMDFRFVVGLPVAVLGDELDRVRQIAAECKKAGAESVIAKCGSKGAFWTKGGSEWQIF